MNDTVLMKCLNGAFVRDEEKDTLIVIPKGASNNDALIINRIGKEIFHLIDGKRKILDIKKELSKLYHTVPYHQIYKDVDSYIKNLFRAGIIKVRGEDKMYLGKDIKNGENSTFHRCGESEYVRISNFIKEKNLKEIMNAGINESSYYPLNIRSKLFSFSEEFYIKSQEDGDKILFTLISGRNTINKVSSIGRISAKEDVKPEEIVEFMHACIEDYCNNLDKECNKIRFTEINSNMSTEIQELLFKIGFQISAVFENEFGEGSHHFIYDFKI